MLDRYLQPDSDYDSCKHHLGQVRLQAKIIMV